MKVGRAPSAPDTRWWDSPSSHRVVRRQRRQTRRARSADGASPQAPRARPHHREDTPPGAGGRPTSGRSSSFWPAWRSAWRSTAPAGIGGTASPRACTSSPADSRAPPSQARVWPSRSPRSWARSGRSGRRFESSGSCSSAVTVMRGGAARTPSVAARHEGIEGGAGAGLRGWTRSPSTSSRLAMRFRWFGAAGASLRRMPPNLQVSDVARTIVCACGLRWAERTDRRGGAVHCPPRRRAGADAWVHVNEPELAHTPRLQQIRASTTVWTTSGHRRGLQSSPARAGRKARSPLQWVAGSPRLAKGSSCWWRGSGERRLDRREPRRQAVVSRSSGRRHGDL